MDLYPEAVEELILQFSKLPSIGKKSAERLALYIKNHEEDIGFLIQALEDVKEVGDCVVCGNLAEDDLCFICQDQTRDQSVICVVEDPQNLVAIEKSKEYRGLYHVLGGLISPMRDVSPDSINLDSLLERADKEEVDEVILAISSTVEGEMTTMFLAEMLKDRGVAVTKIASGIPMGGNLEYFDSQTLFRALEERREV